MAISFAHVSIHSRHKGHSAVAAAAYRSGSKLHDERTGITYDFTNRKDVKYSEVMLPEQAHDQFQDRQILWNEVERAETRKNSQVSKDIVLALPKELNLVQHIELAKRFAQVHFVSNVIAADISIHDHGDGNPHAHILITTRRMEHDRFAKHKARDLNPVFAKGFIVEEDHWNDQWRDFQNAYFEEIGFDLSVDFDHVIPERHEGGFQDKANHYIREENNLIKEARQDIALHDIDNFINIISIEHSVFTRRDIENLLFKTIELEHYNEFFQLTVERIFANKNVICLGENALGQKAYTTRHQFIQECNLLKEVDILRSRQNHQLNDGIKEFLNKTSLSEEQKQAFEFVVSSGDITCVVGRPGVGKSYMLSPVNSFYESQGCRVLGAALSGKVAKQLHDDAGINASTIASLTAKITSGTFSFTNRDILIIDEAGMVDFANMSFLINRVKEARAKLILVGDPDQLRPIKKGAIFRSIAEHVGCFTMVDIKRQRDEKDRKASISLARGQVDEAIKHYHRKNAITIANNKVGESATNMLISGWFSQIYSCNDLKNNIILAHANSTIHDLNQRARDMLIKSTLLDSEQFLFTQEKKAQSTLCKGQYVIATHTDSELGLIGGEQGRIISLNKKHIVLQMNDDRIITLPAYLRRYVETTNLHDFYIAKGERILFKKGDQDIGVKNGDIGSVLTVNEHHFEVSLDSGAIITIPKRYKQLDYAYAMTVHKSQGMSVENAFVCVDTKWWDRALGFVAMTRHKTKLELYANSTNFPDMEKLINGLSQKTIADNVIDYPINLGQRHGFGFDGLMERAVAHVTKGSRIIIDKAQFLYHYAQALKQQKNFSTEDERNLLRHRAKEIAHYCDLKSKLQVQYESMIKSASSSGKPITELEQFDHFYKLSSARDKKAADLLKAVDPSLLQSIRINQFDAEKITKEAMRHEARLAIKQVLRFTDPIPSNHPELSRKLSTINIHDPKHQLLITYLAKQKNALYKDIIKAIEPYQTTYRAQLLDTLKKKNPALDEYISLRQKQDKIFSSFEAEKIDKKLTSLAKQITSNDVLRKEIKNYLPKLMNHLNQSIQKGIDRERGIDR